MFYLILCKLQSLLKQLHKLQITMLLLKLLLQRLPHRPLLKPLPKLLLRLLPKPLQKKMHKLLLKPPHKPLLKPLPKLQQRPPLPKIQDQTPQTSVQLKPSNPTQTDHFSFHQAVHKQTPSQHPQLSTTQLPNHLPQSISQPHSKQPFQ